MDNLFPFDLDKS